MCTLNESLKNLASERVNAAYVASLFNPFRHDLIKDYYKGADAETLAKEIAAFDADTENGTHKVIIAASTKVDDNGRLKDENGEVMENAVAFATVKTTDKDGNTVKTRQVFRCIYDGNTVQRNISIVASWLEFRATRENSFAWLREIERDKKE